MADSEGSGRHAPLRRKLFPARPGQVQVGQVVVIESIPEGQWRPGRRLREDLETQSFLHRLGLEIRFKPVRDRADLAAALAELLEHVTRTGRAPILHIECHGGVEGLELEAGPFVTWEWLKPYLVAINLASRMNLVLVLAACYGGYFASTCHFGERAPIAVLLGPNNVVEAGHLSDAVSAFYTKLLGDRDATEALTAAVATVPQFPHFFATAEGIFRLGASAYLRDETTSAALRARAVRIAAESQPTENGEPPSIEAIMSALRAPERQVFEEWRRIFFALDVFPELEERFEFGYDDLLVDAAAPGILDAQAAPGRKPVA